MPPDSVYSPTMQGQVSNLPPEDIEERTINFVYSQLAAWRDDPTRTQEEDEERLNAQLSKFLDSQARKKFQMVQFHHEEKQTKRRRVDISAGLVEGNYIRSRLYSIYKPILVFEGKRLPSPAKNREREYVTGGDEKKSVAKAKRSSLNKPKFEESGGIQRYKLALHGAEHDLACLIGYVQAEDPAYWRNKVNEWIDDYALKAGDKTCAWDAVTEKLGELQLDLKGAASSSSTHPRSVHPESQASLAPIVLRHLWVVMKP